MSMMNGFVCASMRKLLSLTKNSCKNVEEK